MKGQRLEYFFAHSNAMRILNDAIFTAALTLVMILLLLLGFILETNTLNLDSKIAIGVFPLLCSSGTLLALMDARKKVEKVMRAVEMYVPS